ncbi:MAG TPA: hypothetical protein VJS17_11910 [Pyrinomonadaceae bacterium]|nr:hypothetical protein [Pyrinomonadaceae bacterium]
MFLFLRLCSALLSAYIFVVYMPNPARLLYRLSPYYDCPSEYCWSQWYWYANLAFNIQIVTAALWIGLWAILEVRNRRRFPLPTAKILTHLRYGPVAVFAFYMVTILAFDFAMIQYSRWKIISYVYSDAPVTEMPEFRLHNNYRHWCGNGAAAQEYALYGDTAAAYIDSGDPATRARALQASMFVYDWLNHPGYGPAIEALKKATADPDPMVRDIATRYSSELGITGVP